MRWAFGMVWSGVIEVDGRWMGVNGRGMREGGYQDANVALWEYRV